MLVSSASVYRGEHQQGLGWTARGVELDRIEWPNIVHAQTLLRSGDAKGCLDSLAKGKALRGKGARDHAPMSLVTEVACLTRLKRVDDARRIIAALDPQMRARLGAPPPPKFPANVRRVIAELNDAMKPALEKAK